MMMDLMPTLLSLLVAVLSRCLVVEAWTSSTTFNQLTQSKRFLVSQTLLSSLAPSADREQSSSAATHDASHDANNIHKIQDEIERGRRMEGGQVIDFSSIKASSKAEAALASARQELIQSTSFPSHSNGQILGINDDVIGEVGHPLGTFAEPKEIQDCATWIRSTAPEYMFATKEGLSSDASSFTSEQISSFRTILEKSFEESGEVTGSYAKTFYMGTMLLGEEARKAIWAIYVWCRRTDEIVDAPRESDDEMLKDLSSWEMRLEHLWQYGEVEDVFDLALLDVRVRYPTLDITPFMDMIRGMLMDVPGLGQDRYETFDELHLYCYRVAGTVGLMSLPVFGCSPGYNDEIARYA